MYLKILYLNFLLLPLMVGHNHLNNHVISVICEKVIDGDTLIVKHNGKKIKIRLSYVDAPEVSQKSLDGVKIGKMTKEYLLKLLLGKSLKLILIERDFFGRWIAEVYLDKTFINLLLIQKGLVVLYPKATFQNLSQKENFLQAYFQSRVRGEGIWKTKGFVNPKHFRRKKKSHK